jgi:hypothetical protein
MKHRYIIQIKEFYRTVSGKLVMILEYAEEGDLQGQVDRMLELKQEFQEKTILSKCLIELRFN